MSDAVTSFWKSTKVLPLPPFTRQMGATPARSSAVTSGGTSGDVVRETRILRRRRPELCTVGERLSQSKATGSRTADRHAGRRRPGHKGANRLAPCWLGTLMTGQIERGVPAIGDGNEIAIDGGAVTGPIEDLHALRRGARRALASRRSPAESRAADRSARAASARADRRRQQRLRQPPPALAPCASRHRPS